MSTTAEALIEQAIVDQLKGKVAPKAAEPTKVFVEPAEITPTGPIEVPEGKQTFKDIIGKVHPSDPKSEHLFFTKHEVSDWDEKLQALVPEVNPHFTEFDLDYALSVLMNIEYDKPLLAYGPPGTGKSVTPEQICARINYPYMFVQGMGGTEPADYIGSPWVTGGNMEWKDGPISWAVRHGAFLLYDEPFKSSAQTNMCIQSLLDSRRELKLYGHPDDASLKASPTFRICLADNVRGVGDNMDKYAAEVQDQATLNRCNIKVKVDYPSQEIERVIVKRAAPSLDDQMITKIAKLAVKIRSGWKKGQISLPFTLRDTQEWATQTEILRDPMLAFKFCYLNAIDKDDSEEGEEEYKAIMDMMKVVGL